MLGLAWVGEEVAANTHAQREIVAVRSKETQRVVARAPTRLRR